MQTLTVATTGKVKALTLDKGWAPNKKAGPDTKPVFLFTMTDGERLVVKAEGRYKGVHHFQQQASVRWASDRLSGKKSV